MGGEHTVKIASSPDKMKAKRTLRARRAPAESAAGMDRRRARLVTPQRGDGGSARSTVAPRQNGAPSARPASLVIRDAPLPSRRSALRGQTGGSASDREGRARRRCAEQAPGAPISEECGDARADWLVWQLADSAFPIGGFAHSAGLEAAWQHGQIASRAELLSFTEASLLQVGHGFLPFMTAAHSEPAQLPEIDRLCDAFTTNHVANRASRAQGRALLAAAERAFGRDAAPMAPLPCGHFAPVFGATTRRLGMARTTALRLFVFSHVRAVMAAAVRLNIVGPLEAQALQYRLAGRAEAVLLDAENCGLEDVAQTAPLLDLWQGAHDRLYSRLFQS